MGIVGIAVIVFAIMYLFLVEKMGKRFKQEADAARELGPPPSSSPAHRRPDAGVIAPSSSMAIVRPYDACGLAPTRRTTFAPSLAVT